MGATSRIVAAVMIGLAVTGCALTGNGVRLRSGLPSLVGRGRSSFWERYA
jgi:hypothetical protein